MSKQKPTSKAGEPRVIRESDILPKKNRLKYLGFFILVLIVAASSYGVYELNNKSVEKNDEGIYVFPDGSTSVFDEEERDRLNEQFLRENPDFINDDYTNTEEDDGNVQ